MTSLQHRKRGSSSLQVVTDDDVTSDEEEASECKMPRLSRQQRRLRAPAAVPIVKEQRRRREAEPRLTGLPFKRFLKLFNLHFRTYNTRMGIFCLM